MMSDWQPQLYLEFGKERTQPSIDLVTRIPLDNPGKIIDIGCGPGNSTFVLKTRWPRAEITGLDSSASMVGEAKDKYPEINWLCTDASGDLSGLGTYDLVFSNAAIQWMPHQDVLLSKLFGLLNKNGIFAAQIPCTKDMPIHTALAGLVSSGPWKGRFANLSSTYSIHTADAYYNIMCKLTTEIDLWETRYFHVMDTHNDLVKWYSGSGLRPYLDCLGDPSVQADFIRQFESLLASVYPFQPNGKILFPFTRIFFIASRV